jgi:hypothetical protein
MAYANTRELKEDVLFRGSENLNSSGWNVKVIDYLNRVYRTLCSGASEFLPEYVEDWWWLRDDAVLTLLPIVTAGTLTLTAGAQAITFTVGPTLSAVGWKLRVEGHPELFEIATHTAGLTSATLDAPWTGVTGGSQAYKLMKVSYSLSSQVAAIISPMIGYRGNPQIIGLSPERLDSLFPLPQLAPGTPTAFALENEQTVRFSHGGRTDAQSMRIEYRFRPVVADLTDSTGSIPVLPLAWRHLLADMALTYLLLDKNDDRSNAVALAARTGLAAMLKENRRRIPKMDNFAGHIFPRGDVPARSNRGPLRTESGLIIG